MLGGISVPAGARQRRPALARTAPPVSPRQVPAPQRGRHRGHVHFFYPRSRMAHHHATATFPPRSSVSRLLGPSLKSRSAPARIREEPDLREALPILRALPLLRHHLDSRGREGWPVEVGVEGVASGVVLIRADRLADLDQALGRRPGRGQLGTAHPRGGYPKASHVRSSSSQLNGSSRVHACS